MSETSVANKSIPKRRATFIITIAVVIILLLVYAGGIIVLPLSILSSYKSKNCGSALTLNDIYTSIYPGFIEDKTLTGSIMECAVYTLAGSSESEGVWRDSYNAYQVYSQYYPNGMFVTEAHEHSATALTGLAKDQIADGKYTEALVSLNEIIAEYGGTSASADAASLYPEMYSTWGADLQGAGDFEGAERILIEFKTWAQDENDANHSATAQGELAQTYLAWGMALQSQKQFEAAKAKFDLAVSYSPELASQVQANEGKFYTEWGDYLITQKDFNGAMEQYGTVAALLANDDPTAAKDVVANGYIRWAAAVTAEEDFIGALVLLDFAQENAATDQIKTSVDNARSDLYLAFSDSVGEQAQKAMKNAIALVCKHHTNPSLPIFGMDNDAILVGTHGVDGNLPTEFTATTPSSLHYVVCIEESANVVGSAKHTLYASAAGFRPYLFERIKYTWTITLREADTGEETATTIIEGGDPPPFPTTDWEIYTAAFNGSTQYFGQKPDFAQLVNWLAKILK